jgi:hypothetical protein
MAAQGKLEARAGVLGARLAGVTRQQPKEPQADRPQACQDMSCSAQVASKAREAGGWRERGR